MKLKTEISTTMKSEQDLDTKYLLAKPDHSPADVKHTSEVKPIVYDPKLLCFICQRYYKSKKTFKFHMNYFHDIIISKSSENGFVDSLEQVMCKMCFKWYNSEKSLKQHYRYIHQPRNRRNENPEIDFVQLTCNSCVRIFKSKESLRSHLSRIHMTTIKSAINSQKGIKQETTPQSLDNEPYSCSLCNRVYKTRGSFLHHCRYTHHTIRSRLRKAQRKVNRRNLTPRIGVIPDIYDPHFNCRSCERTYKNEISYWQHLRRIHKMKLRPYTHTPKQKVDEDTKYFCSDCNYTYKNVSSFKYHEYAKHRYRAVTITTRSHFQPNAILTMDDPNVYCRACDRIFKSRIAYRQHVHATHNISLESFRKQQRDHQEPDIESHTLFICQICSTRSRNRSSHRYHLFCKHEIPYSKSKKL